MTVGVAIGDSDFGAKLFLQLEEGLEDFLVIMEIVVHDVDKQCIVHYARNELARRRARFIDLRPLMAELICLVLYVMQSVT